MPEPRTRLGLSPLARAGILFAGLLLVMMVVLLVAVLGVLSDSRSHIQAQDHKIAALLGQAGPLIEDSRPLVRKADRLAGPLRAVGDDVAGAAEMLPAIEAAARETAPLARGFADVNAPAALRTVGILAAAALDQARLPRALDASNRALATLERSDALETIPRDVRAIPRLERLQRRTLRIQRLSLEAQLRSLVVQRETLKRAESVDRKTGGSPPQTPVTP